MIILFKENMRTECLPVYYPEWNPG